MQMTSLDFWSSQSGLSLFLLDFVLAGQCSGSALKSVIAHACKSVMTRARAVSVTQLVFADFNEF